MSVAAVWETVTGPDPDYYLLCAGCGGVLPAGDTAVVIEDDGAYVGAAGTCCVTPTTHTTRRDLAPTSSTRSAPLMATTDDPTAWMDPRGR